MHTSKITAFGIVSNIEHTMHSPFVIRFQYDFLSSLGQKLLEVLPVNGRT